MAYRKWPTNDAENDDCWSNVYVRLIIFVAFAILFLGLFWTWEANSSFGLETNAQRGNFFGGYLGSTLSLVSSLFFLGALLKQSHELKIQQQELSETRKVAKEQAKHLENQVEVAKMTSFRVHVLEVISELNSRHQSHTSRQGSGAFWTAKENLRTVDYVCWFIEKQVGEPVELRDQWQCFRLLATLPDFEGLERNLWSDAERPQSDPHWKKNRQAYPRVAIFTGFATPDENLRKKCLQRLREEEILYSQIQKPT